MKVITAVEALNFDEFPSVFLAGGITNCPEWQDEVIEKLLARNLKGTTLNPRRKNFPIHDPNAAEEQIKWEFNALNRASIFTMWFSDANSDQPICMYELGRHLTRYALAKELRRVAIGVEPGYRREQDVRIQTGLIDQEGIIRISTTLDEHVERIAEILESDA